MDRLDGLVVTEWYAETKPTYNAVADETPTQWNDIITNEENFFQKQADQRVGYPKCSSKMRLSDII
ncbi:MAG: hypothetical protein ACKPKO_27260 [Candidatus Fonsibacter sp.]